jgi:pSer/pThr/pTyr-binding forkhead associated (FHA) protein
MCDQSLDLFFEACGATDALRLVVEHAEGVTHHSFRQPFVVIGRDARADLWLDNERLARRHVYLQLVAGRLLYVDFHSLVAAGPDGPRRCGWLDPGHALEVGPFRIRLAEGSPEPGWAAARASPYGRGALRAVTLELTSRAGRTLWQMRRPIALVGSAPECKVRLRDPWVSRFHCALVGTPGGLWAVDLLGRGGIAVNGAPIRAARLDDGDRLRVGGFTVGVCHEAPAGDAPGLAAPAEPHPALPPAAALPQPWPADAGPPPAAVAPLPPGHQQLFVQMQQLMGEQFQQAMGLFVEAFWAMHREQARLVRRELKRIRLLTQELTALQAKLARRPTAGPPAPTGRPQRPAAANDGPTASHPGPAPGPEKPRAEAPLGPVPIDQSPADLHAWLSRRVADVQRERQSSWQRLRNLLQGGAAPAKPDPPTRAPG